MKIKSWKERHPPWDRFNDRFSYISRKNQLESYTILSSSKWGFFDELYYIMEIFCLFFDYRLIAEWKATFFHNFSYFLSFYWYPGFYLFVILDIFLIFIVPLLYYLSSSIPIWSFLIPFCSEFLINVLLTAANVS